MEEYWNEINLIAPPLLTYSISRRKFDVVNFKKLFEKSITYFSKQNEFNYEVNQISQFIYLSFHQYRMMKGFLEMKKTHQVAVRIKRLNIVDILETLNSYISDDFQSEISLPYRQNLDYVLIKLQGLSKLLIRLVICSRKSAKYILGLIKAGSFYIKGTIYVSSLAKIWNMGRDMCMFAVTLFNNLRAFREKLRKNENLDWIANKSYLPENLNEWLGKEFEYFVANEIYDDKMLMTKEDIDNFINKSSSNSMLLNFLKEGGEEIDNDVCMHEESIPEIEVKVECKNENEIEDFLPLTRNVKIEKNIYYNHSIDEVTTKERVKLFLKYEDKYRKMDAQKSLTIKKIKTKDWKELKRDLNNKMILMQENALIEYFDDYLAEFLK